MRAGCLCALAGVFALSTGCADSTANTRRQATFLGQVAAASMRPHSFVPLDARTDRIRYVVDRVFQGVGEGPASLFGRLGPMTVGANGSIYVVDQSAKQVWLLDEEGKRLGTRGRRGRGPGEFEYPGQIAASGDLLWVAANSRRRVLVWTLDGALREELELDDRTNDVGYAYSSAGDGTIFVTYRRYLDGTEVRDAEAAKEVLFARVGPDGLRRVFARFPSSQDVVLRRGTTTASIPFLVPRPAHAADGTRKRAYLTPSDRYEVAALDLEGGLEWVISVPSAPRKFGPDERLQALKRFRILVPEAQEADVEWPEVTPAIEAIRVAGNGDLHVFPYFGEEAAAWRPVDVYAPDGQLRYNALAPNFIWDAAWSDFVFAVRENEITAEYEIVRYRIETPDS